MSRMCDLVLRYPKLCLALLALGAAFCGWSSLRMESDPSILSFLRESDPESGSWGESAEE